MRSLVHHGPAHPRPLSRSDAAIPHRALSLHCDGTFGTFRGRWGRSDEWLARFRRPGILADVPHRCAGLIIGGVSGWSWRDESFWSLAGVAAGDRRRGSALTRRESSVPPLFPALSDKP